MKQNLKIAEETSAPAFISKQRNKPKKDSSTAEKLSKAATDSR